MTESSETDLARLRAELAGVRDVLAQRDRALVAAHRAAEIAQADNAALKQELEDRHACENCGGKGSYWTDVGGEAEHEVCDCWIRADHVLHHEEHPGAALLAEMDAARAALDQIDRHVIGAYSLSWDAMPEPCDECGEMREIASQALATMKKVRAE